MSSSAKENDTCPQCEAGYLQLVTENPPYSAKHLQCPSCDSTYCLEDWMINVIALDVEASQESLDKLNA